MPGPLQQQSADERRARQLAALLDLGFERIEQPVETGRERVGAQRWRFSQSAEAMGTRVSLSVFDGSRDRAEQALGEAREEMARVVGLLNRFDSDSALTELNRNGRLAGAPDELLAVLGRAQSLAAASGGAFDVTVQPVVDLLRSRRDRGLSGAPPEVDLREALARVGRERLRVRDRDVHLRGDGSGVTLDGIAKGYVVDRMAGALAAAGTTDYLIDAGGDVRSRGTRDGHAPWRVAVRDPDRADRPAAIVPVTGGALATSGGYEIFFDDEQTCHHIVEAGSGRSPNRCRSVTVRASDAMTADALATSVYVLGPSEGRSLVERMANCECLILTDGGRVRSSGWPAESFSRAGGNRMNGGGRVLSGLQLWSLVVLRWLVGWHFLYEGLAKILNPYWTSAGYLASAEGPLSGFFVWLASHAGRLQAVDALNKFALMAIGAALLLGFGTRLATVAGILLLGLYYLAHPPLIGAESAVPQEGSYLFVNKVLVEIGALAVLFAFPTSHLVGLQRWVGNGEQR